MNFRRDITKTESCVFLWAEDTKKAQVILSNDDWLSLALYVEHLPALEPRSNGFSVYRRSWMCHNQVAFVLLQGCSHQIWNGQVSGACVSTQQLWDLEECSPENFWKLEAMRLVLRPKQATPFADEACNTNHSLGRMESSWKTWKRFFCTVRSHHVTMLCAHHGCRQALTLFGDAMGRVRDKVVWLKPS